MYRNIDGDKKETNRKSETTKARKQDVINYIKKTEDVGDAVAKDTYDHMSDSERKHIANEVYKKSSETATTSKNAKYDTSRAVSRQKGTKLSDDPYVKKAMKKLGLSHKQWSELTNSQKYDVSNEAYKMEERADRRKK